MHLYIQTLRRGEEIRERLRHDGWQLLAKSGEQMLACHPSVMDEKEARRRLHVLGLLTSAALRVEFQRWHSDRPAAPPGHG